MERDNFDEAIDEIVAFTGGDMRLALRLVLVESVLLEEELRQIGSVAPRKQTIPLNFPSRAGARRPTIKKSRALSCPTSAH